MSIRGWKSVIESPEKGIVRNKRSAKVHRLIDDCFAVIVVPVQ